MLAAAMRPADPFVDALRKVNLPARGAVRCAAGCDDRARAAAVHSRNSSLASREAGADLRSRIAAARALAELGDPRFEEDTGLFGKYSLPPFIDVPVTRIRLAAPTATWSSDPCTL